MTSLRLEDAAARHDDSHAALSSVIEAWRGHAPRRARPSQLALFAQEEVLDRRAGALARLGVGGAQFGHCAVQHLLREAARQGLEHGLYVLALGQLLAGAGEFERTPLVGLGIELADQRHDVA